MAGRKLGRGLEFLLSQNKEDKAAKAPATEIEKESEGNKSDKTVSVTPLESANPEGLLYLEVERIHPNPHQPRKTFSAEEIEGLANSIQSSGILQPLVVRKKGKRFELIAGERRLRAARKAGLPQVPVILREVGEAELRLLALVENVQREDLNPMEKARSFREFRDQTGWTQEKLAQELGIKRSTVANFLRLNELSRTLQDMVRQGEISMGHAKALLQAPGGRREDLARITLQRDLSVRGLEQLAAQEPKHDGKTNGETSKAPAQRTKKAAWAREMEDHLLSALGCRSTVRFRGGRGKIILDLGNRQEFDRIFELLMNCLPHESEESLVAKKRTKKREG